jgi:hypothetical protein
VASVQVRFVVLYLFYSHNSKDAWDTWISVVGAAPDFISKSYEFPFIRETCAPFEVMSKLFAHDSPKCTLLASYVLNFILRSFLELDNNLYNVHQFLCSCVVVPSEDSVSNNNSIERSGFVTNKMICSSLHEFLCEILKCNNRHSLTVVQVSF